MHSLWTTHLQDLNLTQSYKFLLNGSLQNTQALSCSSFYYRLFSLSYYSFSYYGNLNASSWFCNDCREVISGALPYRFCLYLLNMSWISLSAYIRLNASLFYTLRMRFPFWAGYWSSTCPQPKWAKIYCSGIETSPSQACGTSTTSSAGWFKNYGCYQG